MDSNHRSLAKSRGSRQVDILQILAGRPSGYPTVGHRGDVRFRALVKGSMAWLLCLPVGQASSLASESEGAHQRATYDFYGANLERKFGRDYVAAWRSTAITRLRAWGFNTIGNWSEPHFIARAAMPYVVPIEIWGDYAQIPGGSGNRSNMPDVFDPKFATAADAIIAQVGSRYKGDPFLIGYFVDNERAWGIGGSSDPRMRFGLAVDTLRLPAESPAKQAFVQALVARYHSASAFASAWGVAVSSWDTLRQNRLTLSNSTLARSEVSADLSEFTARYADAYFQNVATAMRRHDPNHLYLGSRFQERTPEAVEACARYCDVVSFNVYDREISGDEWVRFHKLKPAIIGEFQFGTADRGLFWPGLYNVGSEDQRGPAYSHYLRSALANPDIVGCH
jgi:Beta-galactosidase